MQITPPTLALASSLAGISTNHDIAGKTPANSLDETSASRIASAVPVEPESNDTDTVSISANGRAQETNNAPAPVYAEIWRGAVKVAQVDIHGHVISYSGLVASGGGGIAGPLLAAQRAIQVAQQTGGEIRSAGEALDNRTLLMRAWLANTYVV